MPHSSWRSQTADPDAIGKELLQSAYNSDGLPEITIGLFFLLASGLSYALAVLPKQSLSFKAAVLSFAFLLPLFSLSSWWAVRWVRRRYLIERFGYVQYKPIYSGFKQIGPRIVLTLLPAIVILAIVILAVMNSWSQPDRWPGWLLGGTGLLGGAIAAGIRRPRRMVIYGIVMAATGLSAAFSEVPLLIGFTILFGVQGLVTLITGGVVFLRFMRKPVEAGE